MVCDGPCNGSRIALCRSLRHLPLLHALVPPCFHALACRSHRSSLGSSAVPHDGILRCLLCCRPPLRARWAEKARRSLRWNTGNAKAAGKRLERKDKRSNLKLNVFASVSGLFVWSLHGGIRFVSRPLSFVNPSPLGPPRKSVQIPVSRETCRWPCKLKGPDREGLREHIVEGSGRRGRFQIHRQTRDRRPGTQIRAPSVRPACETRSVQPVGPARKASS